MITLELTEEDIGTLIEALGDWMEQPARDDTREWLRRQDAGADLDMDLREAFNRRDDGWGDNAGVTFIQVGTYPPLADRIRISLSNDPIDW